MMKFLKTVQLDISDQKALPKAAFPGEWAVTGTFAFADVDAEQMDNKQQLAFRNGWLGVGSFGRATFVQVVSINEQETDDVIRALGDHLNQHYGAPDLSAALEAARMEVSDAQGLCDHPLGTLLSITRELTTEGITERIHVVAKTDDEQHARIWTVEQDEAV